MNLRRLSLEERREVFSHFTQPVGFVVCGHCNGYGSSLEDPRDVDTCSVCGGTGLMKEVPDAPAV